MLVVLGRGQFEVQGLFSQGGQWMNRQGPFAIVSDLGHLSRRRGLKEVLE